MRLLAASLALLLAAAAPAPQRTMEQEVKAFANAFDEAQQTGDRAALERMTADDMVLVSSTGRREGKINFIAGFTDPKVKYGPFIIFDRTYMALGPDAAIIGGHAILPGTAGGKPFTARIRFTDVFKKQGGEWKVVYVHATKTPDVSGVTVRNAPGPVRKAPTKP